MKVQCFAHKHNTVTWSVCELRPPNIESSTLTIWSPHLPQCLAFIILKCSKYVFKTLGGCPGVPVHEGIPFVFITIHGVMTQFVNVSFFCVPVHEDTTDFR